MGEDREQRLRRIMANAANDSNEQNSNTPNPTMVVSSQGVIVIGGANTGDVNLNVKRTIKKEFTPTEQHILPATALKIQTLIANLVDKETASGADRRSAFSRWWSYLNRTYGVTTYREIPREMGDDAVAWLQQKAAQARPKIRNRNKPKWRTEHYTGVWARSKQLNMSKGDVYKIVNDRLGKRVTSLTTLNDKNRNCPGCF